MSGLTIVSFSETDTIKQCDLKHELSYVERWTKPARADGALSRGTAFHHMMDAHYGSLKATQMSNADYRKGKVETPDRQAERLVEAKQAAYSALATDCEDRPELEESGTAELVRWMYDGYVEQHNVDEAWEIVAIEHNATFALPTERGTKSAFRLKMKIDLVVRIWTFDKGKGTRSGRLWVVDHKTCKDLPRDKNFELDDQFGLYTWGLRLAGKEIFGQIHNAVRTHRNVSKPQPLDERFRRTMMYRTEAELSGIALDAYRIVRTRYRQQAEVTAFNRKQHEAEAKGRVALPLIDSPRATDSDRCGWRCDFTDACLFGRKKGREALREMLRSQGFEQNFQRH